MRTYIQVHKDGSATIQRRYRHLQGHSKISQKVVLNGLDVAANAAAVQAALESVIAEQSARVSAQVQAG